MPVRVRRGTLFLVTEPILSPDGEHVLVDGAWIAWDEWPGAADYMAAHRQTAQALPPTEARSTERPLEAHMRERVAEEAMAYWGCLMLLGGPFIGGATSVAILVWLGSSLPVVLLALVVGSAVMTGCAMLSGFKSL